MHTRKISLAGAGVSGFLFWDTGGRKKLRDRNRCHVEMHRVMIAMETEPHPRSSDKNSGDTWGMESTTTSMNPQESLSIVNRLRAMMPALAGEIAKHKSH